MARRGLDQMSAWILAVVASGALYGGGYALVRIAGKVSAPGETVHANEHGEGAHGGGGHESAAHDSGDEHGGSEHGNKADDAPEHGKAEEHAAPEHGEKHGDAHGSPEHGSATEHGGGAHGDDHGGGDSHGSKEEHNDKPAHGEQHGAAPHWEYKGSAGPEHWAELGPAFQTCAAGKQQSPIDIDAPNNNPKLLPIRFNYKPAEVAVQNNGHTIQVDYPLGNYIELEGERYDLVQFHFHAPSEHKVAGIPYDFELHFVHKSAEGKLAVVGVLFEEGGKQKPLDPILEVMPHEKGVAPDHLTVDPNTFLPKKRTFYTYSGSLTTPPCSEGVRWLVLSQPQEIAAKQVDAFVANVSFNARPVQPLRSRHVLKSTR